MPRAAWGVYGYLILLGLGWVRLSRPFGRFLGSPIALLSMLFVVVSLQGLAATLFFGGRWCLVCAAIGAINLALLIVSVLSLRHSDVTLRVALGRDLVGLKVRPVTVSLVGLALVATLVAGNLLYPKYWLFTLPRPYGPGDLATGLDAQGHPWIGATRPMVTIEEFSDYECPMCARSHAVVRQAVAAEPQRLRLVHRAFPLDLSCNKLLAEAFHDHACLAARAAQCAAGQGRFWMMNDLLYASWGRLNEERISRLAVQAGLDRESFARCLEAGEIDPSLRQDIQEGIALGGTGTPFYTVNGRFVRGGLSAERLAELGSW